MRYIVMALIAGPSFGAGIALYLRLRNQVPPPVPISTLLILGLVFGPILEESLFRGVLIAGSRPERRNHTGRNYHRCHLRGFS
jgi:membrane protease YdiL (CAAX protease family)